MEIAEVYDYMDSNWLNLNTTLKFKNYVSATWNLLKLLISWSTKSSKSDVITIRITFIAENKFHNLLSFCGLLLVILSRIQNSNLLDWKMLTIEYV